MVEQVVNYLFLLCVGLDVLDMMLIVEQVKVWLLLVKFCNCQFFGLFLDQVFFVGFGNYLWVEIFWQVGLSGKCKVVELSDSQLDVLVYVLFDILWLFYCICGLVDDNKYYGVLFCFKVFYCDGERCECCGGIIEKMMFFLWLFYWCSGCQY